MKKLALLLPIILICSLIIIGCGSTEPEPTTPATPAQPSTPSTPSTPATTDKHGGHFTFVADRSPAGNLGWLAETFTLVPQYMLYNSLVKAWYDGTITPDLAKSWDIDTKEPSITFHLRDDVKFHDGTPFTAQSVKFNMDKLIEAKKRPDWVSWEVIDKHTVKVVLKTWRNTILEAFDGQPFVSNAAVADKGIDYIKANPIGTGPFKFVEFVQDKHLVMEPNPDYWDGDKPYFDIYEIVYVPDFATRRALMQKHEGDMVLAEMGKEASEFVGMDGIDLFVAPQATAFMIFDDLNEDSPYYKKEVREAVDYAIDRDWLAESLGFGQWQACYQLVPRTNQAFDKDYQFRKHDIDKAKKLLAEAGYPNGFKTTLYPNPTALNRDLWVAIQAQLKAVGIDADIQFLEPVKFQEYRNYGTWTNGIVGDNMPAYGNMNRSLEQMLAPDVEFYQSMNKKRPNWVTAINATTTTKDYDASLVKAACRALYDNVSVIPLAEGGRGYAYGDYVKDAGIGERSGYFWAWAWDEAWLDK